MPEETYEEILARVNAASCGDAVQVPEWFLGFFTRHDPEFVLRKAFKVISTYVRSELKKTPGVTRLQFLFLEPVQAIITGFEEIDLSPEPTLDFSLERFSPAPGYVRESVSGLRHRTASLLARVMRGETFVITVRGRPVARLCPLSETINIKETP